MPSLLEIGLANAVCAGFLALVALAAGRVCRRPAILHGLWLLVLVKLVTPPLFSLPLRVLPAEEPVAAAAPVVAAKPPVEETPITGQLLLLPSTDGKEVMIAVKLSGPIGVPEPVPTEPAPILVPPPDAAPPVFDWSVVPRLVIGIWAAGALAWFAVSIVRMVRFQRALRHATPAPADLQARAADLGRLLGLSRCPEILLVPGSVPPMLWTAIG